MKNPISKLLGTRSLVPLSLALTAAWAALPAAALGADQAGRVHRAGRHRRRRRPDGAPDPGHRRQAQADEAAAASSSTSRAAPGAEGFLDVKGAKGDPHKIVVTLSNLFTHAARDRRAVQLARPDAGGDDGAGRVRAVGQRRLAVQDRQGYLARQGGGARNKFKMGGTGSKQEDQIITVAHREGHRHQVHLRAVQGRRRGRGAAGRQAHRLHVNNPIEAVAQWRAGQLRALCVFDEKRMPYTAKSPTSQSWDDIPTCKEAGVPIDYTMLRGIFMPPGVTQEQIAFYVDLLKKVRGTPEWKDYMEKGAFKQTFMTGDEFNDGSAQAEKHAPRADEGSRLPGQVTRRKPIVHAGTAMPGAMPRRGTEALGVAATRPERVARRRSHLRVAAVVAAVLVAVGGAWSTAASSAPAGPATGRGSGYFPFYIGLILLHRRRRRPAARRCCGKRRNHARSSSTASSCGACCRC